MMWITPLNHTVERQHRVIGGKGAALQHLRLNGFPIPETLCVTSQAYHDFVDEAGLREKIQLELSRKAFSQMRWEEIWDTSQRIRLMFLRSPMPSDMEDRIRHAVHHTFGDQKLVVRSSGTEEDRNAQSFAGMHASYTHLKGTTKVIQHIRLVWASLWSDAALLYRQELGLDSTSSDMAVLVQEMIPGEVSGIYFTQDPTNTDRSVIEAIHGMNPPLVDGRIAPDRWILDAAKGSIISHTAPDKRDQWLPPSQQSDTDILHPLPLPIKQRPPLDHDQITILWSTGTKLAAIAGGPQDIEWTFRGKGLVLLQSRPITTSQTAQGDKRAWYLSLHRSLDNLLALRQRIEKELIPRMKVTASEMAAAPYDHMSDAELANEIERRWKINQQWTKVYWEDFIPFAHGMRLFGQVYNDLMAPEDPYAFMQLLKNQELISVHRNRSLAELADGVRAVPERARALEHGDMKALDEPFRKALKNFIQRYGDLSCPVTGAVDCAPDEATLANMLLEMAKLPEAIDREHAKASIGEMEADFLDACRSASLDNGRQLLSLARSSYRLRDDDNIILGAIEAQLIGVIQEAKQRDSSKSGHLAETLDRLGLDTEAVMHGQEQPEEMSPFSDRQITGQPAGPGLARGPARVIRRHSDIARFKGNEILVCDAVDPNMTFVIPLASGIIERRGGMLIHGAIIAREYGLPCVTGVADATSRIRNGQTVTVDGYLGIVTLSDESPGPEG